MNQRDIYKEVEDHFKTLPGKRGADIPAEAYDHILHVARGITMPVWGRPPTPHQMQHLYDHGMTDADAIHEAFDSQPHPFVPHVKVGEYADWKQAYRTYKQHKR